MDAIKIALLFLIITICMSWSSSHNTCIDCSIARAGKFTYGSRTSEILIDRNDSIQIDKFKFKNETYYIKSKIDWQNDCEYTLTMLYSNAEKMIYQPGDVLKVKIDRIDGRTIYYTTSINGKSWGEKMTKL